MQNTVHVIYELLDGADDVELGAAAVGELPRAGSAGQRAARLAVRVPRHRRSLRDRAARTAALPPLRLVLRADDATFTLKGKRIDSVLYPVEESRGYQAHGDAVEPRLLPASRCAGRARRSLVASTESFETMTVLVAGRGARRPSASGGSRLIAQADPGGPRRSRRPSSCWRPISSSSRRPAATEEAARARASGDEVRTVIAGYHWFTDWGRDTMISLEGLTLATGRHIEAGYILRTFAHYVRDGLIPNMFPEGEKEGLYHTADATLWFFHAIARYRALHRRRPAHAGRRCIRRSRRSSRRTSTARTSASTSIRPTACSRRAPTGYQLTWMDAKVDDWVVTPRRGKAVEINALWYNALRLMEQWAGERGDRDAADYGAARRAGRARRSTSASGTRTAATSTTSSTARRRTTARGNDAQCRPNQLLAISLPHPVLERGALGAGGPHRRASAC